MRPKAMITAFMAASLVLAIHASRLSARAPDLSRGARAAAPLERMDGDVDSISDGSLTLITDYGRETFSLRGAKIVPSRPLASGDRIAVYFSIDPATELFVADSVYRLARGGAVREQGPATDNAVGISATSVAAPGSSNADVQGNGRPEPESLVRRDHHSAQNKPQAVANRVDGTGDSKSTFALLLSEAAPWTGLGTAIALVAGLMVALLRNARRRA
ncbi:MAG TPA: hypothetical protein VKA53_08285 [Thermoanaerobaculia bacterium]|nr:hypothetical protein [Thermoanaerobaculia bacterium]